MPESWRSCRLGDIAKIKHGWPFKSEYFSTTLSGKPIIVSVGNFRYEGGFRFEDTTTKEYGSDYPRDYELAGGDILLVMTCQTPGGEILGIPARVPRDDRTYLHNQRLGKVEMTQPELIDPDYLYYLFLSKPFNHELVRTASGTKILHTAPSRIEAFEFERPPLLEQRAIAGVLGALDDKIESNRRTSRTLEKLARAIFRAWFVDFEPVKAKAAGARSFPSMPQQAFDALPTRLVPSELGPIPEGWSVGLLGDQCEINALSVRKGEIAGEIEYIDIASVTVGRLDGVQTFRYEDAPTRARRRIRHGDTIWSCVRPNHRSYLFVHAPPKNRIVSTGFAVLSPGRFGASLLHQVTTQPEFVDYLAANADGSAYPAVRPEHFAAAGVVAPPESLRETFEAITMAFRDQIACYDEESRKLATLRDYLLPKLMSGAVRVECGETAGARLPWRSREHLNQQGV